MRFNSTMVRLKPGFNAKYIMDNMMFQFHYGQIKTKPAGPEPAGSEIVSIPLWSD